MKRGTTRHPKLLDLCSQLHCYRPTAIGYLTLLWEFAAEYAQPGDVGRYGEKRLEAACGWRGKRGELIRAMYHSGWLDLAGEVWSVHDWSEHCEESVHRWLHRHKMKFVVGQPFRGKLTGQSGTSIPEVESLPLPLPLPLPKTPPGPPSSEGGQPPPQNHKNGRRPRGMSKAEELAQHIYERHEKGTL